MFLFGPVRLLFKIPSLIISGAVIYLIVTGVQVIVASRSDATASALAPASAIVVLPVASGASSTDETARLEQALALYRAHVASRIVVAGTSSSAGAANPSLSAKSWLVARGVTSSAIVALPSANAAATLSTSAALFGKAKVVVVTDAMDALWTRGAAASDGLVATVSPAVGSTKVAWSDLDPLWRQATGVAVGRIIGYGRTGWAYS